MKISTEPVCIGIDIGGTNLRCALVSREGEILFRDKQVTVVDQGREQFLMRLFAALDRLRHEAGASGLKVAAIGIGVPGLISNAGVIYSSVNLLPLEGLNLTDAIRRSTGLPSVSVNDANASTLGEKRYGAGRPYDSLLVLTLGTGVGSGLILNGRLWTGIDGVAAEYGHATVEPAGFACPCGNHGCLEQYASASALVAAARRAVALGQGGMLADLPDDKLTAGAIALAARSGDSCAVTLFVQLGRYLGIAAAAVVNLLNLEAIILGGGVSASFDLFFEAMQQEMLSRTFAIPGQRVRLLSGELGDDAGILGAAAMAWELGKL
jgi:glucokinase